jgi:hypothetical protein
VDQSIEDAAAKWS